MRFPCTPGRWAAATVLGSTLGLSLPACSDEPASSAPQPLIRATTLQDDASKLPSTPGAYEWWNFFAEDDDEDISVSVIFLAADPFNVDYRRAVHAHLENPDTVPAPSPSDYHLLQIAVTVDGKKKFVRLFDRPGTQVEFSTTEAYGRIGQSTFRGSIEEGVKTYHIEVDAKDTGDKLRFEADLVLTAGAPGFTVTGEGLYAGLPDGAQHAWQFPIARPRSEGTIRVTNSEGEVVVDREVRGGGYVDHMWGSGLAGNVIASWHFATVDLRDEGSMVYVWLTPAEAGAEPTGYVFRVRDGELASGYPIAALTSSETGMGSFDLPYDADYTLQLEGGGTVRCRFGEKLGEDWPFQVAGPANFWIDIPGDVQLNEVPGVGEYLWQPGIDSEAYAEMFDMLTEVAGQ
ncbi:MAG: hypothetical protein ACOC1F_09215 [Myxococcota bacterium]